MTICLQLDHVNYSYGAAKILRSFGREQISNPERCMR